MALKAMVAKHEGELALGEKPVLVQLVNMCFHKSANLLHWALNIIWA